MRNVDPADVPEHGTRHDFTLLQVGVEELDKPFVVVKAIIDSGDYKGKKVSTKLKANSHDLPEFAEGLGVMLGTLTGTEASDWREYLEPLLSLRREKRFSASLSVEPFESRRARGYKYGFTFVDEPALDREMGIRKRATQFDRD